MHGTPISGSKAGVCEMIALPDGRLLVMERSLAFSVSGLFLTRIYLVDTNSATDVSGLPGLIGQTYAPAAKTLIYSGGHANLEGLCIGPRLGPGRYALLGVVDDGDPVSRERAGGVRDPGRGSVLPKLRLLDGRAGAERGGLRLLPEQVRGRGLVRQL
jgi:hypothetical protein